MHKVPIGKIDSTSGYLDLAHCHMMADSFRKWTGKPLVDERLTDEALAEALFAAPFALVSHGVETDPIFNFGNRTALSLFEMTWDEFVRLPSRLSAEPMHRDERQRLMDQVTRAGFISDYRGIRISSSGRRFVIDQATVWNLVDSAGVLRGQAALFAEWKFCDDDCPAG